MPLRHRLLLICLVWPGLAAADPSALCLQAGLQAGQAHGVPPRVMEAITLTETGRGTPAKPWPWTVNVAGEGHWFATRNEAQAFAETTLARGQRSFDVGCFQVNYRWHGQHFPSLRAMFEPATNADYAARFLRDIYPESGNWSVAAGTYHSRTSVHATRYRAIFDRHFANAAGAVTTAVAQIVPRVNSFPLLQRPTQAGRLGSLVSLGVGSR